MTTLDDKLKNRNMDEWLEQLGFSREYPPFKQLVAENDQSLTEEYFQKFLYLDTIQQPECTFLFLRRGAGKSASRFHLEKYCKEQLKTLEAGKLNVNYTDFHRLILMEPVTLTDHIQEILHKAVPRLFEVALRGDRQKYISNLSYEYKKDFVWFITNYSQSLSLRSLEKQIYKFEGLSPEKRSEIIKSGFKNALDLVNTIAKVIPGGKPAEIALNAISSLLEIGPGEITDLEKTYRSSIDMMGRFAEIAKQLGIATIYISVDRVDEYAQIYDYPRAANMLKSLIEAIPLLEMPGYAFKFFLPIEMRKALANHLRSDRFPIIGNHIWLEDNLRQLLQNRLLFSHKKFLEEQKKSTTKSTTDNERQFLDQEISSFERLFEDTFRSQDIVAGMIRYADHSPRNLLKIAKIIFEEHTCSEDDIPDYISEETYQRALVRFATEQLHLRALDKPAIEKLVGLNLSNRTPFTELLSGADIKNPEEQIKEWEKKDFYIPHFSLSDLMQQLGVSKAEARETANQWEDEELITSHYKITDENLVRYLFTPTEKKKKIVPLNKEEVDGKGEDNDG